MPSTFTKLTYHLVFSTKNREPLLHPPWQDECYRYLAGVLKAKGATPIEINGMEDHVHLLIGVKPDVAIADLVRDVKANTSRWANESRIVRGEFAWQEGYAAFTVSESQLPTVREYIRTQKEHHQRRSLQEEFAELLRRHGFTVPADL